MPSKSKFRFRDNHQNRDLSHSLQSVASSTGSNHGTVSADSTMTDFDPEKDEAIMSTRQVDELSQRLPKIRDTAKKVGRWAPRPQEFVINTSVIGRAFPDFSQGESSDDSMSFEVGRGAASRNVSGKIEPLAEYSDHINSSPVIFHDDYNIITTPKRGQVKSSILKEALRNSAAKVTPRSDSRKENIPPADSEQSTPVRGSPYISHASRTISTERRTLAELHARVTDDSDGSQIGSERPTTVTLPTKNTRFSASTTQVRDASNKQQTETSVAEKTRANSASIRSQNNTTNSTPANPTTHSFILPNMPDVSLNAGTIIGAMPVSIRGGKVQHPSANGAYKRFPHEAVDAIALPDEEEDIFRSLKLIKARIIELEKEKAGTNKNTFEVQAQLKALQNRYRDALGSGGYGSDSDDEPYKAATGLTAHAITLTNKLETSERKASNLQLHVDTLIAERDSALKELVYAEDRIQKLAHSYEDLEQENKSIRDELQKFLDMASAENRQHEKENQEQIRKKVILEKQNAVLSVQLNNENAQNRLLRKQSDEHLNFAKEELTQTGRVLTEMQELRKQEKASKKKHRRAMELMRRMIREQSEHNVTIETYLKTNPISSTRQKKVYQERKKQQASELARTAHKSRKQSEQVKPTIVEQQHIAEEQLYDETYDADTTRDTTVHRDLGVSNLEEEEDSLELSDVSSVDIEDIAEMRRQLRQSRKFVEAILATASAEKDETVHSEFSIQAAPATRTISGILKKNRTQNHEDYTGRVSVKSVLTRDANEDLTTRSDATLSRRHSEPSGHRRNTRSQSQYEDMTSAFILPDIEFNPHEDDHNDAKSEIRNHTQNFTQNLTRDFTKDATKNVTRDFTQKNAQDSAVHSDRPVLSSNARQVFDGLCKHDLKNCTMCSTMISVKSKKTVIVTKPIPVSERMPIAAPYEDEPTLRPSVDPGIALATVIKGLKDEIAHLKADHSRVQEAYIKHDATLSMKKRKALKAHLDKTLASIDRKSDQLYALYDVLEGQKSSGQAMTEAEIEVTLVGLGIIV